jgi:hypothetical protein
MEVTGRLHDPAALSPGKEQRYPVERRLGESLNQSGRGGEKEKIPSPAVNRTL